MRRFFFPSDRNEIIKRSAAIASVYFVLSMLWIFFSDNLVSNLNLSPEILGTISTIKGALFVLLTSLFFFFLLKKSQIYNHPAQTSSTIKKNNSKNKNRDWFDPVLLIALFSLILSLLLWMIYLNSNRNFEKELQKDALSAKESVLLKLAGNKEYLRMLAEERASGVLNEENFQIRTSQYLAAHQEFINITWVNSNFIIQTVSPYNNNKQIIGLKISIPEPKAAAIEAKIKKLPVYTKPFEAIQGNSSFEIWMPVFSGNQFLGFLTGVYSCQEVLEHALPSQLISQYYVALYNQEGGFLGSTKLLNSKNNSQVYKADLNINNGMYLSVSKYSTVMNWLLLFLGIFILGLICALGYGVWLLKVDMKDRVQAENELIVSELKYRYLFENNPQPMWIYDIETFAFLEVNQAALNHYGYTKDEFLKMTIKDIRPEEDNIALLEHLMDHKEIVIKAGEWRHKKKNGEIIYVEITSNLIEYEDRKARLILSNDITDRKFAETEKKLAEDKIKKLNAELEIRVAKRTSQLQAANKELEAFSYSVSHDLRAPLRSIDGFSQALLEDYYSNFDSTGRDYLNRVRSAAQKMSELIDALLNLAKVNRFTLKLQEINLSNLAESIFSALKENEPERNVDIIIEPDIIVNADSSLIKVVMQNLIENAWKFTAKTGKAQIEFGKFNNGSLTYFIKDNGAGFNMAYINKLFNPFQRLHNSHEFSGTGIGLATVQRIIHRHHGKVSAEGITGKGATFYFTLNT